MTPLPKRKTSPARRDRRRAHDALEPQNGIACPNCGEPRLSHRVCPKCGYYQGKEVLSVKKA